ncbi:hypothetical protein [uncultured Gimesia sp.]|uniref:hypothetical protein n=1 Tax=uncultured Gimesia sp. TaxID=1678688 RepID=UPI0026120633|nr:hypothetical protein [uncultured Gimesia sp.]
MKVFIVLHHEIGGAQEDWRADEMVFYTCTSMKKALELIKECYVVRWSWWEIQVQEMNSQEWPEHVGYYGRRGGKLTKPPYKKCVEIYKKEGHS